MENSLPDENIPSAPINEQQPEGKKSIPDILHHLNFSISKNTLFILLVAIMMLVVVIISLSALSKMGRKTAPVLITHKKIKIVAKPTPVLSLAPTPTPNPTTYWSIYIDDTNDFSINYPQPWVQNSFGLADPSTGQTQVAITVVNVGTASAVSNFIQTNTQANETPKAQTINEIISGQQLSKTSLTLFQQSPNGNLVEVNKLYGIFIPLQNGNTLEVYSDISKQTIINDMASTFSQFPQVNQSSIATWQTYNTASGYFHFDYPSDYTLAQQYKTVSGSDFQDQSPNFVQLFSPTIIQNEFQITIFYQANSDNYTLPQAIDNLKDCASVSSNKGQQIAFSGVAAYFFPNTPCGVNPVSYIYVLYNNLFYTITISSDVPYNQIQQSIIPILNTFSFNGIGS